ncbi:hypothetical protein NDU88_006839 [Pleurodeles waltl]|uniref:Uncharacterized protein n=1 Tax=Pleurodeles waltl TaxID=8319 RepID=A0AAV7QIW2_PLEWA|nr:hypothetical protein NDU88_006839 [Pleurodeles waltl]
MARAFTLSPPRSSGLLFQRILSLQHHRSPRAVTQELAITSQPPICTAGRRARGLCFHRLSTPFSGHLFQRTLSLQHRRSLRAVSEERAVASRPLICTTRCQPNSPQLHRLSALFFRRPLPVHSLTAAPSQPLGRLPRACCYQLASDLHLPAARPAPSSSPSQHPGLQASRGSRLPTRPHSKLGWRPSCASVQGFHSLLHRPDSVSGSLRDHKRKDI